MTLTLNNLRPYQQEAAMQIGDLWDKGYDKVLACHAVGSGKTFLGGYVVRSWVELKLAEKYDRQPRVLWLAYTDEQIDQACKAIGDWTGEVPLVKKSGGWDPETKESGRDPSHLGRDLIVSSVQSMMQEKRLAGFGTDSVGLVVLDEAHHCVCDAVQAIIEKFKAAKWLFLTATPNRTDRVPLGKIIDAAIPVYGMAEAMRDGWLCRLKLKKVAIKSVDWSRAIEESDLSEDQIAQVIEAEGDAVHAIVKAVVDHAGSRPTLIYAPRVLAAEVICNLLRTRYKPDAGAEWVSGTTSEVQRRDIVERFREGKFQYLCNCGVFTEGTDLRNASCAAIARPIKSEMLYEQIVGRILRGGPKDPVPGKVDGLVLDLMGTTRKKLVSPVDLLGGNWDECVRDHAYDKIEEESAEGVSVDVLECILEAKRMAEEIRLEARKKILVDIKATVKTIDPFTLMPMAGADSEVDEGWWERRMADDDQVDKLKELGIPVKGLTHIEAKKLIRESARLAKEGLASYRQRRKLRGIGITTELSWDQAQDVMTYLKAQGWRPQRLDFQRLAAAKSRNAAFRFEELRICYTVPLDRSIETIGGEPFSPEYIWRPATSTKDTQYTRVEYYEDGCAVFSRGGWLCKVAHFNYRVRITGHTNKPLKGAMT